MSEQGVHQHINKHIGKVKKGALHEELHMKPGQKISTSKLEHEKSVAKRTHNKKLLERVDFALNMRH